MAQSHSWSGTFSGKSVLNCYEENANFWEIDKSKYNYCPACGEQV